VKTADSLENLQERRPQPVRRGVTAGVRVTNFVSRALT
jgi:hypothetical protein